MFGRGAQYEPQEVGYTDTIRTAGYKVLVEFYRKNEFPFPVFFSSFDSETALLDEFNDLIFGKPEEIEKVYDMLVQFLSSESEDLKYKLMFALLLQKRPEDEIIGICQINSDDYPLELNRCKLVVKAFLAENYKPLIKNRKLHVTRNPQPNPIKVEVTPEVEPIKSTPLVSTLTDDGIVRGNTEVSGVLHKVPNGRPKQENSQNIANEEPMIIPVTVDADELEREIEIYQYVTPNPIKEPTSIIPNDLNEEEMAMMEELSKNPCLPIHLMNFRKRFFAESIYIHDAAQCFFVAMTALSHNKSDYRNRRFEIFKLFLDGMTRRDISKKLNMNILDVESCIQNATTTVRLFIQKRYPNMISLLKHRGSSEPVNEIEEYI